MEIIGFLVVAAIGLYMVLGSAFAGWFMCAINGGSISNDVKFMILIFVIGWVVLYLAYQ